MPSADPILTPAGETRNETVDAPSQPVLDAGAGVDVNVDVEIPDADADVVAQPEEQAETNINANGNTNAEISESQIPPLDAAPTSSSTTASTSSQPTDAQITTTEPPSASASTSSSNAEPNITPGPRATALQTLHAKTLTSTLRSISPSSFLSCFPSLSASSNTTGRSALTLIHTTLLDRLETFARRDFEEICRERRVVQGLNELETLIGEAKRARARGVDAETKAEPGKEKGEGKEGKTVPPHLQPSTTLLTAHLAPILAAQQSRLNARLQTVQSRNAQLWETVTKQRGEIEELISKLEGGRADLEGAVGVLGDSVLKGRDVLMGGLSS